MRARGAADPRAPVPRALARGDVPRHPLRVATDAADQHRRERVQERQADEVQAGRRTRRRRASARASRPRRSRERRSTRRPCRSPVHQITLATSSTRPSSSTGCPSRTPATRASVRSTPASSRCARLTRSSGAAVRPDLPARLAAERRVASSARGSTTNHITGSTTRADRPSKSNGSSPFTLPDSTVGWLARRRRARCPRRSGCADDEHRPVLKLRRVAVRRWSASAGSPGQARRRTRARLGSWKVPDATTTLSASKRCAPARTT